MIYIVHIATWSNSDMLELYMYVYGVRPSVKFCRQLLIFKNI